MSTPYTDAYVRAMNARRRLGIVLALLLSNGGELGPAAWRVVGEWADLLRDDADAIREASERALDERTRLMRLLGGEVQS